jgi:hypothetical protein
MMLYGVWWWPCWPIMNKLLKPNINTADHGDGERLQESKTCNPADAGDARVAALRVSRRWSVSPSTGGGETGLVDERGAPLVSAALGSFSSLVAILLSGDGHIAPCCYLFASNYACGLSIDLTQHRCVTLCLCVFFFIFFFNRPHAIKNLLIHQIWFCIYENLFMWNDSFGIMLNWHDNSIRCWFKKLMILWNFWVLDLQEPKC